jgi:hypothetical protein
MELKIQFPIASSGFPPGFFLSGAGIEELEARQVQQLVRLMPGDGQIGQGKGARISRRERNREHIRISRL